MYETKADEQSFRWMKSWNIHGVQRRATMNSWNMKRVANIQEAERKEEDGVVLSVNY